MTTIAWDGKTLAADRRMTWGNTISQTNKLFRVTGNIFTDALIGISGEGDHYPTIQHWFNVLNCDTTKYPESQTDKTRDVGCTILMITQDLKIWTFGLSPHPMRVEDSQWAIGSGMDFAIAAMYCGQDACSAVRVASIFDKNSGNGVDKLSFPLDSYEEDLIGLSLEV